MTPIASDEIKALLRLRKLNQKAIASTSGVSRGTLSKMLNGTPVKHGNGHVSFYHSPGAKQAICDALSLPYESVWGPDAKTIITKIIHEEITERLSRVDGNGSRCAITLSVRKRYSPQWSLKRFFNNLINLGRK